MHSLIALSFTLLTPRLRVAGTWAPIKVSVAQLVGNPLYLSADVRHLHLAVVPNLLPRKDMDVNLPLVDRPPPKGLAVRVLLEPPTQTL